MSGSNFDGQGAFKFALINAAATTTYWSNDGTSNGGSEPVYNLRMPWIHKKDALGVMSHSTNSGFLKTH